MPKPDPAQPSGDGFQIHRDDLDDVLEVAAELQLEAKVSGQDVFTGRDLKTISATTGVDPRTLLEATALFKARKRRRNAIAIAAAAAVVAAGGLTSGLWWSRIFPPDPAVVRQEAQAKTLKAEGLTTQAIDARVAKRYDDAIAYAKEAVEVAPGHYKAWNIMGLAYKESGRFSEAREAYQQGVAVAGDQADAANLYYNYGSLLDSVPETRDEAVVLLKRAIKIKPSHADAHNNLGYTYEQMGRLDEARAEYLLALKYEPTDKTVRENLASLEAKIGLPAAKKLDPLEATVQAEALRQQGDDEYEKKRWDAALKLYLEAVRIDPKNYVAWNDIGLTYEEKNDAVQAMRAFRQATVVGGYKSDNCYAYYNLGRLVYTSARKEDAIALYQQALKCRPDYASAHNRLGWTYKQLGRYDEAIRSYEAALKAEPSHNEATENLKALKARLGRR